MSRLSDLISAAVADAAKAGGRCDVRETALAILPDLDTEARDQLVTEALVRRVKDAATRGYAELVARASTTQAELPFNLHSAYALDLDGRYVKQTVDLTQVEFERAIQIREAQLKADVASVDEMKRARAVAKPHWTAHPDWTLGACLRVAVAEVGAA